MRRQRTQNGAEWCEEVCTEQCNKLGEYCLAPFERAMRRLVSWTEKFIELSFCGKFFFMMALLCGFPFFIVLLCVPQIGVLAFLIIFSVTGIMSLAISFLVSQVPWRRTTTTENNDVLYEDEETSRRSFVESSPVRVSHRS